MPPDQNPEVQADFLGDEILRECRAGRTATSSSERSWMGVSNCVGVRDGREIAEYAHGENNGLPRKLTSVELFAGAGGLALGVAKAGFKHLAVVERNPHACETIRRNQQLGHPLVRDWPLHEADVTKFDFSQFEDKVDLLAGGPPCQPFSLGGKHRGKEDKRDLFPEMIRAVREIRPKFVLVENVKGLLRPSFAPYFDYILKRLEQPEITKKPEEKWEDHQRRLQESVSAGLRYRVAHQCINTADYGVPQKRWRVIILGIREDLDLTPDFPEVTHSDETLLWEKWVSGDYWKRHGIQPSRVNPSERLTPKIAKLEQRLFPPMLKPWATVRDAFSGLPEPELEPYLAQDFLNHAHNPGAKSYPGHTGSPLDLPAKALKAGDHGVPGGENMLVRLDSSIRYFTVRESVDCNAFPTTTSSPELGPTS